MSRARDILLTDVGPMFRWMVPEPVQMFVQRWIGRRHACRRLIDASGLSAPIASLINDVVRATHLRHGEKLEVARELISHFEAGLAAGADENVLLSSFGDCHQAAVLIRRAMKRRRPLAWKVWVRSWQSLGALVGIVFLTYVFFAVRLYTGRPVISHNYLADLNAKAAAVPEADRAWPMYRKAMLVLYSEYDNQSLIAYSPDCDAWQETVDVLGRHEDALALIRQAAAMPSLGYLVGFGVDPADAALWPDHDYEQDEDVRFDSQNHPMITAFQPHLGVLDAARRFLTADAYIAAEAGDSARVVSDITALISMAFQAREVEAPVADLVAIVVIGFAAETLSDVLRDRPDFFDEVQLRRLAHTLSISTDDGGILHPRAETPRNWFYDDIQRMYTDDGHGNGRITQQGIQYLCGVSEELPDGSGQILPNVTISDVLAGPALAAVMANRREMINEFDRIVGLILAEKQKPLWEQGRIGEPSVDDYIQDLAGDRAWSLRYLPVRLLIPPLSRVLVRNQTTAMQRDAALIAIAANLYRRQHDGAWPESLEQMVPDLLPAVPLDRYVGRPMGYRIIDGEVVVYCVGADGDDDGGRAPVDPEDMTRFLPVRVDMWMSPAAREAYKRGCVQLGYPDGDVIADGDWILWTSARPADEGVEGK